jgi:hypothetical protein
MRWQRKKEYIDASSETYADESVLGLELLKRLDVIIDQTKTSALTSTEGSTESIDNNELVVSNLVHLGKLVAQLGSGDIGTTLVDDVQNL